MRRDIDRVALHAVPQPIGPRWRQQLLQLRVEASGNKERQQYRYGKRRNLPDVVRSPSSLQHLHNLVNIASVSPIFEIEEATVIQSILVVLGLKNQLPGHHRRSTLAIATAASMSVTNIGVMAAIIGGNVLRIPI